MCNKIYLYNNCDCVLATIIVFRLPYIQGTLRKKQSINDLNDTTELDVSSYGPLSQRLIPNDSVILQFPTKSLCLKRRILLYCFGSEWLFCCFLKLLSDTLNWPHINVTVYTCSNYISKMFR